jgi:hypothetical protein
VMNATMRISAPHAGQRSGSNEVLSTYYRQDPAAAPRDR